MNVALLVLVVLVAGCQCLAVDTAEMAEYDPEEDIDQPTGLQWGKKKEAFMAYLSRPQELGKDQHVKFDRVILNDGNRYNPHTGVFMAKYSGVYMFSYSIAQSSKEQLNVRLVVDGHNIDGAVAPGGKHGGCHCGKKVRMGGNSAVIHVCKGHSVYIEAADEGEIEGSNEDRYTTFSGHLLYTRH